MKDLLQSFSRRAFLSRSAGCLGSLALADLVSRANPATSKNPMIRNLRPKARAVISLFQHGGPSQMDLFDFKPQLRRWSGKPYPSGDLEIHFDKQAGNVLDAPYEFHPRGQCGMELSELLPHTGSIADDITLVRSMTTGSVDHESALRIIHTGRFLAGLPSFGSWVLYGLGSENETFPLMLSYQTRGVFRSMANATGLPVFCPPFFREPLSAAGHRRCLTFKPQPNLRKKPVRTKWACSTN